MDEIYYRYEGTNSVALCELKVIKHNPQSVWVDYYGTKKICYKNARKSFAYPTKKEAFNSFLARKKKQLEIYKSKIHYIEEILEKLKDSKQLEFLDTHKFLNLTDFTLTFKL